MLRTLEPHIHTANIIKTLY